MKITFKKLFHALNPGNVRFGLARLSVDSMDQLSVPRALPCCDFGPKGKGQGQQEIIFGLTSHPQQNRGTLSDEGLTLRAVAMLVVRWARPKQEVGTDGH